MEIGSVDFVDLAFTAVLHPKWSCGDWVLAIGGRGRACVA